MLATRAVNQRQIHFGLEWLRISGDDTLDLFGRVRDILSEKKVKRGVLVSKEDVVSLGVIPTDDEIQGYSAAAAVAHRYRNGLFAFQLDKTDEEPLYWFCHVEDGLVVAYGETLTHNKEEIAKYLRELELIVRRDTLIYTDESFASEISGGETKGFREFLLALDLSNSEIRKSRALPFVFLKRYLALFTAVAAFIVLGVAGFVYLGGEEKAQVPYINTTNPVTQWREVNTTSETVFYSGLQQFLTKRPLGEWMNAVMESIGGLKSDYKGWRIASISCFADDTYCKARYENKESYAVNRDIQSLYGDAHPISYSYDGKYAEVLIALNLEPTKQELSMDELIKGYELLSPSSELFVKHLSSIQLMLMTKKIRYTTNNIPNKTEYVPTKPPIEIDMVPFEEKRYFTNNFTLSGEYIVLLKDAVKYLKEGTYFGNTLTITFAAERNYATWELGGFYVHR